MAAEADEEEDDDVVVAEEVEAGDEDEVRAGACGVAVAALDAASAVLWAQTGAAIPLRAKMQSKVFTSVYLGFLFVLFGKKGFEFLRIFAHHIKEIGRFNSNHVLIAIIT